MTENADRAVVSAVRGESSPESAVLDLFQDADGGPDRLRCARLLAGGRTRARAELSRRFRWLEVAGGSTDTPDRVIDQMLGWSVRVSGAEVVAAVLAAHGVEQVFAYAGTSELALCDAVEQLPGVHLVNGRGDRESAFMAGGASSLRANRGAAILHGARGLTNAAGALADIRRNEIGAVFVVGLPSTGSARFLPPHAEPDLIKTLAAFAGHAAEVPSVPEDASGREAAAVAFVAELHRALDAAARAPFQPSLFGIPQDVAEEQWVGLAALAAWEPEPEPSTLDGAMVHDAAALLAAARRPFILVDDYALRHRGLREAVDVLARRTGAAVAQLRYRRGPMLFERIQYSEVEHFIGWLNQYSEVHAGMLRDADLLVTVEDRNIYRRVVGDLPGCRKIAVNSYPAKVVKNEYLDADDLLLAGDPLTTLTALTARLSDAGPARPPWYPAVAASVGHVTPEPPDADVVRARRALSGQLVRILSGWERPVLVDDSQMFGGLLSDSYDDFPPGLRVFGSHGGFVGSGLAYAVGLAIANPDVRVMCTLGDQAFTNAYQGLVAAVQERARVLFVICNNGESVSLNKQATASFGSASRPYLANVSGLCYRSIAVAHGVPASGVAVPIGATADELDAAFGELAAALDRAAASEGPALVELQLPSDPQAWRGIWLTQGFEEPAPAAAGAAAGG